MDKRDRPHPKKDDVLSNEEARKQGIFSADDTGMVRNEAEIVEVEETEHLPKE
jgi:hypothetical protein